VLISFRRFGGILTKSTKACRSTHQEINEWLSGSAVSLGYAWCENRERQ